MTTETPDRKTLSPAQVARVAFDALAKQDLETLSGPAPV